MAQTVTFKHIPRNAILNQADYEWVQQRLGTPLPLFQLTFDSSGRVATLAVHTEDSCISVFMVKEIECEINLPSTIRTFKGGGVRINCICARCGKLKILDVSAEAFRKYKQGFAVQHAFPELSEDDREWLVSKVCPDCWDTLTKFPEDDDA